MSLYNVILIKKCPMKIKDLRAGNFQAQLLNYLKFSEIFLKECWRILECLNEY